MNVVDSSAWLEYFAGGGNANFFAAAIENVEELIVPTLSLYEVFKRVMQQRIESEALQVIAAMRQGQVVNLDGKIAIDAARLGIELKLPMVDSVMLATAREYSANFWTQDSHFEGIAEVRYRSFTK